MSQASLLHQSGSVNSFMRKILVVDDEQRIRELTMIVLEKGGYEVIVAENGVEALARFQRERPDLVLLDVNMPGMSGIEVCRQLKMRSRDSSHVPVLMFTVLEDEEVRKMAKEAQCDGFLSKSVLPKDLVREVARYLASS